MSTTSRLLPTAARGATAWWATRPLSPEAVRHRLLVNLKALSPRWQDVSWEDAAEGDAAASSDAYALNPDDAAALETDPSLKVSPSVLPPADAGAATP